MKHDNDNKLIANSNRPLRFLSVCSGIEAASVAWPQWEAVAFAEIEKFPSAVLAHHYPDVPNLGDFTQIETTTLGHVDILSGGTPCQAFSIAGARRSLDDERGNLTLSFVELAHELAGHGKSAGNGLRNVIWENVPGVLSTKDNAFGCFLAGLVGADDPIVPAGKWTSHGMVAGPKGRAAWAVKDAQFFGLAQRRKRVIVVADFGNGADPAAVLFEPESLCRNTPPSREAREGVASTVTASVGGCCGKDGIDGRLVTSTGDVAHCLNAGGMGRQDYETETMVAHPLLAKGNSSHDETLETYVAGTICKDSFTGGAGGRPEGATAGHFIPIAFSCKDHGADAGEISPTLRSMGHDSSHANAGGQVAIAFNPKAGGNSTIGKSYLTDGSSYTLDTDCTSVAVQQGWAVRRLTPTECERLQGFPDGYTNIPWRGKPASPDGPRYKALGNSWAVPKFRWLGKRIASLMPVKAANDNYLSRPDVALLAS